MTVSHEMRVRLIDHMGSDLSVVNAARVSFNKHHESLTDGDYKLVSYLAEHNHWTPFAHTSVTLYFKVPLFVARQLHKHQVGFVVNEVSRRYVDESPEFYIPEVWRKRDKNVKQGSKMESVDDPDEMRRAYQHYTDRAYNLYTDMLVDGVCPEQARMVLPQSMFTEFWMTGSVAAWTRLYNQRKHSDTQYETQVAVAGVRDNIKPLFPISWEALTK